MQIENGIESSALEATLSHTVPRIYLHRDTCIAPSGAVGATITRILHHRRDTWELWNEKKKEEERIDGQMSGMKLAQIPIPFIDM